ncbi:MAG: hypothetical protein ISS49_18450, partial [Anaerolineae bacterium]|nr:hypothetical protein [Anaerolineae bacterium]
MPNSQLENLACQLARSHAVSRRPRRRPPLVDRLRGQEALLHDAYRRFAEASEVQLALSYAAEWLLDNFYTVRQALRQVREDMPPGYYRRLPKLATSPLGGYPRIYAITQEIIEYHEEHLNLDQVRLFVQAYQRVTPLTMGELWALPTMLRLGILENLTQAIARVTELPPPPGPSLPSLPSLNEHRPEPFGFAQDRPAEGLADETVVANCILSLRLLATQDWKVFFESVSRVDQVLSLDPANVYARMDFDTRDRYRGVIEELAQATGRTDQTGQDEEEVARETIRLAEEARRSKARSPRTAHIGFYLLDAGRRQLEARLGYRPPRGARLSRWLFGHPTPVYLGTITLLTLVILLGLVWYALVAGGTLVQLIGAGLLVLLPATAVAVSLVNWFITHTVPPRVLPRMDFQEAIPAEYRTMVVIPALLTETSEVESLSHQLELHFLGNVDPHLHFALLTDFADAPQKHKPDDDRLLRQVKAGIQALNKKYSRGSSGPFYLFHRDREWNPGEECWMGWERKRGKLIEFNSLLGGSKETSYTVQMGDLDLLPEIKYVITLDADTSLSRDSASRLVATLAHPLNHAEFDPDSGAVVAGYTVLQPRVEIQPTSANKSLFTQVFAQDTGVDLYTRAVSDVYQDFFGEGLYAGKGIYDVAAFENSLAERAPGNALLSHDLFEGIHGRTALVTDVSLFEDYPLHYLAYTRRLHRWVRGDWQLLPWLLPRVPHAGGGTMPNGLSVLDRWKILDNLRRSLLMPALLALLIAGWLWLPGSALVWTLAAVLAPAMPLITGFVTGLARRLRGIPSGRAVQSVRADAIRWLLALVFLLYETLLMVDAIGCTLVRLAITHNHLLQWTTAAHTIRLFGKEIKVALMWHQMGAAPILALALVLLIGMLNPAVLPIAA